MMGRVQQLLVAFALVNAAGALVAVVASSPQPFILYVAGVASPPALAFVWVRAYRRRRYDLLTDGVIVAGICFLTMAVSDRGFAAVVTLLAATVLLGSSFGSMPRVLLRTGLLSTVVIAEGYGDPATLAMAVAVAASFFLVACLMHGMASSTARYEETVGRAQILAAVGLDLVSAGDLPAIVASAIEGAQALCVDLPSVRVSLAMIEGLDAPPGWLRVMGSAGQRAAEMRAAIIDVGRLVAAGHELADQHLFGTPSAPAPADHTAAGEAAGHTAAGDRADRTAANEPADRTAAGEPADEPSFEPSFLAGEILVTRINVDGTARGVLLIESPDPIGKDLPQAIHALATQVSLTISRMDLQSAIAKREGAERFEAMVQSSTDMVGIVSSERVLTYLSPSVRQILGREPDDLIGANLAGIVHPDDRKRVALDLKQVAAEAGSRRVIECRLQHADGSWRHTQTQVTNLLDVPAVSGIVLNTRDVTEHDGLEAELRHQAFHDALTGLPNRALFSTMIDHALASAPRAKGIVAVLYCDVEGMKRVNESLGYSAGDATLKAVADRLVGCVRGHDTVARLGGNEFGILLERLTTPTDATQAIERIMSTLRQPIPLQGTQVELQPHIGIAISDGGEETAEDLLGNGAVAVRHARIYEGGYAIFNPEMHANAVQRIEFEAELKTALEESQFLVYYQPTIDLKTGRLTGVEALVRWQHPRRGIVGPMEFIPLAEEIGLIVPLGKWVLREACRQVRVWQNDFPADDPIALSVNLSGRQLRHTNLIRDIADALDDSGLLPSRLILEITESVLMTDTAATLSRLFQLRSLGVRLAIDDFGTGYSSLAYLRRFPVEILKIDKSFVDGIATEPTASALVDAMIRIAKTLKLETVAEGVERSEQADRLRALQCDTGQGYLFSRPLPSDQMTSLLRDRARTAQPRADAA
jgi:diguanylate cyclase (GGDEF)-like protein/PAS domain S-box-containing protein